VRESEIWFIISAVLVLVMQFEECRRYQMKSARTLGLLVIGVWFLLWGLIQLITVTIPLEEIILGTLAVIAGLLLLLGL
jgi:uncharacterized membrane protein